MKTKKETSAGGIVFKRQNGKIFWLICQHSYHKGWVFPKGLIGDKKENEEAKEAALREVEEEGGVKAKIIDNNPVKVSYMYQWQGSPHGGKNGKKILVKKTVYYFLMEYLSGDPKNHDWEVSDAKFVLEDEVKKTLTYKADKEAFEKILKIFKNHFPQ
jgi:NTP pyrophosphohydrolases including oxidative damage repair enzymes